MSIIFVTPDGAILDTTQPQSASHTHSDYSILYYLIILTTIRPDGKR